PQEEIWTLFKDGILKKADVVDSVETIPISSFFRSLADNYSDRVIGLLLSGSAADGIVGLKAIKAAGGITFAQDGTAGYQNMPRSAMADGAVDLLLSPKEMAEELDKIGRQAELYHTAVNENNEELIADNDEHLQGILQVLNRSTNVDFTQYKMNTIKRRIIRRMMLLKLNTLGDYLQQLRQQAREVNLLYADLLINVTTFFRDSDSAVYLKTTLLPKLIDTKGANNPIRLWIPACSTGQEAYSMAILILEALGENQKNVPIQIFATDLSETAINKARLGVYTKDDVADVSPQRLQRFFTKLDGSYRIIKSIRDLCVFANHNIAKDPPFSRLDIISCCNLLIYLDVPLQKKLMATFHYSLNNNGFLVLGKSETPGNSSHLFNQVDKKVKIYTKRKDATAKVAFETSYRAQDLLKPGLQTIMAAASRTRSDEEQIEKAVDNLLLRKYVPASVLVNSELDILQFRGATGSYLEPAPGKASLNLMKMAKSGLSFELRSLVHKAKKSGQAVKKEGIQISSDEGVAFISVEALPVKVDGENEYYLVVFNKMDLPRAGIALGELKDQQVAQLEAELIALREDMRSIVEAQEAANEELQSANEEIVSSNEELQSSNEELETSKEEIESSNEELITINQELQIRNEQLAEAQDYNEAIFMTLREAVLILDKDLRVLSGNATFYSTYRLREEEVIGQPIFDLNNRAWNIPKLRELLEEIIPNNGQCYGFEIGHVFPGLGEKVLVLNARKVKQPFGQHKVLVAIEDVTEFKLAQKIIAEREAWFRNTADNAPVMIWVTSINRLCSFVNKMFLDFRGIRLEDAIGNTWALDVHPDDVELCERVYNTCFDEKRGFELNYRLKHRDGSYRQVFSKAKPNFTTEGHFTGFIGSCIEVGEDKII
ncbi:MAG: signal transduction histidine kinase with CheB and CheR, partial [Flaviaesturariibacter sp.]|nr:signal transduction histidine kinase with CheB and CheR [Flaviaesturariibacter sp.]